MTRPHLGRVHVWRFPSCWLVGNGKMIAEGGTHKTNQLMNNHTLWLAASLVLRTRDRRTVASEPLSGCRDRPLFSTAYPGVITLSFFEGMPWAAKMFPSTLSEIPLSQQGRKTRPPLFDTDQGPILNPQKQGFES